MTTFESYENDLAKAETLIQQSVNYSDHDGQMKNWAQDALNNTWITGLSVDEWVTRALQSLNHAA